MAVFTTLGGAIIGAILGSIGTYWARERSRKKQKREQIEDLRRSLLSELVSMEELATLDSANKATKIPMNNLISSEVYRSNSSKISLLTTEETDAVIRFYSNAIRFEKTVDSTIDAASEIEPSMAHDMTPIHNSRDILREEWKDCVLALIAELEEYSDKVQLGDEHLSVDDSMSSGDLWYVLNPDKLGEGDEDVEFV